MPLDQTIEALWLEWITAGWMLVGVSNQPAAAKGTATVEQLDAVQRRVLECNLPRLVSLQSAIVWQAALPRQTSVSVRVQQGRESRGRQPSAPRHLRLRVRQRIRMSRQTQHHGPKRAAFLGRSYRERPQTALPDRKAARLLPWFHSKTVHVHMVWMDQKAGLNRTGQTDICDDQRGGLQ